MKDPILLTTWYGTLAYYSFNTRFVGYMLDLYKQWWRPPWKMNILTGTLC